ncbi:MAG: lysophospholipid acyltransferase family protein [Campylobacterales bacterium]|nr:lysophospholipid acyltransferase family protein [Campylobacterales bacterium]
MSTVQRGSGWSIRLVFFLYRLFGYGFVYYLMYPVTFFYVLVASNVKVALREYYATIGKPFTAWVYFHHLRHFALCMCDRFISRVAFEEYVFDIDEEAEVLDQVMQEGCVLLLSHFGGWAAAGNCFSEFKISIVMQEALLGEIKKIEKELPCPNPNLTIIDLSKGSMFASMEAVSVLLRGEVLAMMADRATQAQYCEQIDFFGKKANFNKNPFYFAQKTQKPLVAIAFVYQGPQHYKVRFRKIAFDGEAYNAPLQEYGKFLEEIVQKNPEQWFNFYHFWKEEK